jgi:hypothetical protein
LIANDSLHNIQVDPHQAAMSAKQKCQWYCWHLCGDHHISLKFMVNWEVLCMEKQWQRGGDV